MSSQVGRGAHLLLYARLAREEQQQQQQEEEQQQQVPLPPPRTLQTGRMEEETAARSFWRLLSERKRRMTRPSRSSRSSLAAHRPAHVTASLFRRIELF